MVWKPNQIFEKPEERATTRERSCPFAFGGRGGGWKYTGPIIGDSVAGDTHRPGQAVILAYSTVRVRVVECDNEPEDPETVKV